MLYCSKCQVLCRNGDQCPSCGSKKLRQAGPGDPVLLLTVNEQECSSISTAFRDAGVQSMIRRTGSGDMMNLLGGISRISDCRVFVPFGEIDHCRDILLGIGFLKEEAKDGDKPSETDKMQKKCEKAVSMSRGKRLVVRIFSIAIFVFLVWGIVNLADDFTDWLKNALQIFQ